MKIYIDTNNLYNDWLLTSNQFKLLENYLSKTNDELCISEVVLEELYRHFVRKYKKAELRHQEITELISIIDDKIPSLREVSEAEIKYRKLFLKRLEDIGVRIIEVPNVSLSSLLERDLMEKRPFQVSGKGFRDALIWESLLSDCHSHDEKAVFITDDSDFAPFKESPKMLLHEDLVSDLISNGFSEDRIIYMKSLNEFNDKYTKEVLDRIYSKEDKIEGTIVESIDMDSLFNQYKLYFIREVDKNLHQLLSINMGLYEKVNFLDYPIESTLLEAYDLEDDNILAITMVSSLIDAKLHTDQKGYEQLLSYTKNKGNIHFILNSEFDDFNNKFKLEIRFTLHALIGFLWNKVTKKGDGAHVIKFSFTREDLLNDKDAS